MQADFRVLLDACVLANIATCDLMLRLAEHPRQYLPLWTDQVLAETRRTQQRLGWPDYLINSFETELRSNFPEALITGFEELVPVMTNDEKDRHVLAAAVHASAELVLTFNLRDFPQEALTPWGIRAMHPEDYLLTLYDINGPQVVMRIAEIAAKRREDEEDVLMRLGQHLPKFASRLLDDLELG